MVDMVCLVMKHLESLWSFQRIQVLHVPKHPPSCAMCGKKMVDVSISSVYVDHLGILHTDGTAGLSL